MDITNKNTLLPSVLSPNNFTVSEARLIDGAAFPGILATGTHDLFVIPKGNMVKCLTIVALENTTSSGAATVQLKLQAGTATAEAVGSEIGKADLQSGDVVVLPVEKIKGYDPENDITVQLVAGTAALTAFKAIVFAEYIPVDKFTTAG